jgi:chromosome segregation ATPase
MVCSLIKKTILGAALGAGALYLAFGTAAPSYVRTAFHHARHNAKHKIPVPFEIERARQEIANLEPAIRDNIEALAQAEVDVEYLDREIAATRANLGDEKKSMVALRQSLKSGDFRVVGHGHVSYTEDEVRGELSRRLDHYGNVAKILEEKQATLKARQKSVVAARKLLTEMSAQKQTLLTKLEKIEAHLKMIEATRATNEFDFDDSALARAKQAVSELEKRLDVLDRKAEMEGRFVEAGLPVSISPSRDAAREFDEKFGDDQSQADGATKDKSL